MLILVPSTSSTLRLAVKFQFKKVSFFGRFLGGAKFTSDWRIQVGIPFVSKSFPMTDPWDWYVHTYIYIPLHECLISFNGALVAKYISPMETFTGF